MESMTSLSRSLYSLGANIFNVAITPPDHLEPLAKCRNMRSHEGLPEGYAFARGL